MDNARLFFQGTPIWAMLPGGLVGFVKATPVCQNDLSPTLPVNHRSRIERESGEEKPNVEGKADPAAGQSRIGRFSIGLAPIVPVLRDGPFSGRTSEKGRALPVASLPSWPVLFHPRSRRIR